MSSWIERAQRILTEVEPPVLLRADVQWGVNRLFASMRSVEQPLIWVDLESIDCQNAVALGDALSEAIRTGLGAPLFGNGLDAMYAIGVLESYLPAIEPISLVVSNAHNCIRWSKRLIRCIHSPNTLLLQIPPGSPLDGLDEAATVLDADVLALQVDEAIELYGDQRTAVEIADAVATAKGAISIVEERLALGRSKTGGHKPALRGRNLLESGVGVDALMLRGKWVEAYEYAASNAPARVPEVIEEAGNALFDSGQFERFWQTVSLLPGWVLRDEAVMYWQFNAAVAVNRWRPLLPSVDSYLQRHEAARLRALRATIEVSGDSLGEAERAYETNPNAVTASALGFVLTVAGDLPAALAVLKKAMEYSERGGRPRLIVSAAGNTSLAYLSAGRYVRAQYWADWAVKQFHTFGLREELLRLHLVNLAAYASLLTGSMSGATRTLSTVHVPDELMGIPTVEGVLSTLGDYALVTGDAASALHYFERTAAGASRGDLPTTANDLVRGYLAVGKTNEATRVASEAVETASQVSEIHDRIAGLALGTALAATDDPEAARVLRAAVESFAERPFGAYCAQAIIRLASLLLRQGRSEEARRLMEEHSEFIGELGDSGWLLLGGQGPEIVQLRRMFRSGEPEIQLRLLGKRYLRNRDAEETLSLRFAELLAVLASNPNGIRGEQLALALYGDRANASTLKATISRARRLLPIGSQPYRIGEACQADFMQVLELLRAGRVQAALELYRGPLLPESDAPAVVELRGHLEESLRQAVLASGDPDAMIDLANQQGDDLELWEETRRHLPPNDPRRPLANARIRRILKRWGDDLS